MDPINEAEVSLQRSVQRDSKTKRDLVLKVLEDMKNNPDRGSNSAGQACETCPPLIRGEFIDYLMEDKRVVDIFWSYGEDEILVENNSRFYTDLNLHVKVSGYSMGESVSLLIEGIKDPYGEGNSFDDFFVNIEINREDEGVLKNIFKDKTIVLFEG